METASHFRRRTTDGKLAALVTLVESSRPPAAAARWLADAAAVRFQLSRDPSDRPVVVVIGGTGTGKSTIVNRLIGAAVSAASFRRTFTAGVVAVAADEKSVPANWLGLPHESAQTLPARGRTDVLTTAQHANDLTASVTLVDTPDVDGDEAAHHAQADRAFRWADAAVFLVTPEKYQMRELLPYYGLAARLGVSDIFVMNKAEGAEVVDDYSLQLRESRGMALPAPLGVFAPVYVVPRDDAGFAAPEDRDIAALRDAITGIKIGDDFTRAPGLQRRTSDLLDRLADQLIGPMRVARREVDRAALALRAMQSPTAGVDSAPLLVELRRRLQERSILYLIGPGKMLDRVRQMPQFLVRMPRKLWEVMNPAAAKGGTNADAAPDLAKRQLDFRQALVDQFRVLLSRIDDVVAGSEALAGRMQDASYTASKFTPEEAGAIADEELADLRKWLELRWNAQPRDTAIVKKIIKFLPGGEKLVNWSEAAPYVLTAVVAAHHAFFGHIDLMILGGYGLFTWLTERASNEVAGRARKTNANIADRFQQLAKRQVNKTIEWMEAGAATDKQIKAIEEALDDVVASFEK